MTICLPSLFIFIFESISKNIYLFIYYKDVNLPLSDFSLANCLWEAKKFSDSDTAKYQLEISFGGRKFIHFTSFFFYLFELQRVEN